MTPYLFKHPPARTQFKPRRAQPSGAVVVHTTENAADLVGLDSRAEQVARFIAGRTNAGSYHLLIDSDSWILLVPFTSEAFGDGTGGNPFAIHMSFACYAHEWDTLPERWIRGAMAQAREALAHADEYLRENGTRLTAKVLTDDEYRAHRPGFVAHGTIDPDRRTDPGQDFPWSRLLDQLETPEDMYQRIVAAYLDGGRPPSPAEVHDWIVIITRNTEQLALDKWLDYITYAVNQEPQEN